MGTTNYYAELANYLVWPSESDHHGAAYGTGGGLVLYEPEITALFKGLTNQTNHVISGFQVPQPGAPPHVVSAGSAIIDGYRIVGTSNISVTLESGVPNFLYLVLEYSAGKVVRPLIQVTTTYTATRTNSIYLGNCAMSGTTVTGAGDYRTSMRTLWGAIAANGDIAHPGSGGFTEARQSIGLYHITPSTAFITTPFALVSAVITTAGRYAVVKSVAPTLIAVNTYWIDWTGTDTSLLDTPFHFVVIG